MKHNLKITALIIAMFFVAQILGLIVVGLYAGEQMPYGLGPIENTTPMATLIQFMISLFFAILIIIGLMKLKAEKILRIWFFVVVTLALGIFFNAFINNIPNSALISLIIALPLTYYKIIKRNILVHNFTELFIYPGIAALFVPILSIWTAITLLILISIYDMYAVWHSGIMQKMAKYQMNKVKVFAGLLIPYISKDQMEILKKNKGKKNKKMKIAVAMLGGGDIVFPIILAGVLMLSRGIVPALFVSVFATLGLASLLYISEKGKFYPAMPFITVASLIGFILSYLV